MTNTSEHNKRSFCYQCKRSLCLCEHIQVIDNQIPVIILQHSREKLNPKNTATLLKLSLKNSQLIYGKNFDDFLGELLQSKNYALVFPDHKSDKSQSIVIEKNKKIEGLILIDGTWKKARKIYYESQILQNLPKIYIENIPNQYIIRKSPELNALSTYEAGVLALKLIGEENTEPLMDKFKTFMEMSLSNITKHKRENL